MSVAAYTRHVEFCLYSNREVIGHAKMYFNWYEQIGLEYNIKGLMVYMERVAWNGIIFPVCHW